MKKQLVIFAVVLLTLSFARVEGTTYYDDKYNFKITAPNEWEIDTKSSKKRVILQKGDNITEVEVDVQPMSADQETAADVATFQIDTYDGWQYHGSRPAEKREIRSANAKSGYVAVYSKRILSAEGGIKEIVVAESYFISARKVYIVSIITDNRQWSTSKKELLQILGGFKII